MRVDYKDNIFLNCPFDTDYEPLFKAILFAISDCGFTPRCTKEEDDSSKIRIETIYTLIESCQYGIHDISRTELDPRYKLPRFNMPLELGLFLSAKWFGKGKHRIKSCLILDRKPYRYQKFISDIAGQEIVAHNNSPKIAIKVVRNWLSGKSHSGNLPSDGSVIWRRYNRFLKALPDLCRRLDLKEESLIYKDYIRLVHEWLGETTWNKYYFIVGKKIVYVGITNDLDRREQEHKQKWPKGHIVQVGRKTTEDAARKWEEKKGFS
jgi:hypothetical protein